MSFGSTKKSPTYLIPFELQICIKDSLDNLRLIQNKHYISFVSVQTQALKCCRMGEGIEYIEMIVYLRFKENKTGHLVSIIKKYQKKILEI